MMRLAPLLVFAGLLGAQEPDPIAVVRDVAVDSGARCRALAALQDRGVLDVPTVLGALGDPDEALGLAAASIVRHEWVDLPAELLAGLDRSPVAARRFLHELALAPRPAAMPWVASWIAGAEGRPADDRCLALAATGRPPRAAEVDLVLRTVVAGEAGPGCLLVMQMAPPGVADALCGRLHATIERGQVPVDALVPLLDRMTDAGRRSLLALATTLDEATGRSLVRRVADVDPELVRARAREMLDGDEPVTALWLDHAAPLLDEPRRVDRVVGLLRDDGAAPGLRDLAFSVLVEAGVVEANVLAFAAADDGDARTRLLLRSAVDRLPEQCLVDWLGGAPATATATVQALVRRRPLGALVEAALQQRLLAAEWDEGPFFTAAASALVLHGSEAPLDAVWPRLRTGRGFADFVDALSRRREPFVHELLVAELAAAGAPDLADDALEERRDTVRLALVALGDRRQLRDLVAHAPLRSPGFVRRCTHYVRLDAEHAAPLLEAACRADDVDLATELLGWAATASDPATAERLWQVHAAPDDTPVANALREVAVRGLAAGPLRGRLQAELRAALAEGPLPERLEPACFELVASTPAPLSVDDARFLAELMLEAPLADPDAERVRRQRWPDGRAGFPLVAAIAQRVRGTAVGLVRTVFADVVARIQQDPRRDALSRQRILAAWRALEADRAAMAALAVPTAPLLLALPDPDGTGGGPAQLFCMQGAEQRGDHAAAAACARSAVAGLLRLPDDRRAARLFLGEREPAAGRDPWAALAAAPYRLARAAALTRGDARAAAVAATLVREFAGRDVDSLVGLPSASQEDPIR